MQTEFRFSLTPRLVALGLFSLVALFVLLFLLGMQVGSRSSRAGEPSPASQLESTAQKKVGEAEAAAKSLATPTAAPAAAQPAPAAAPTAAPAAHK